MIAAPGIYTGTIRHRRFAPRPHEFEYSLFMVLLDVDRLHEAMAVSRLTSYNRWNWATFDDGDHLGGGPRTLRERLSDSASGAGHTLPDGPVFLLTHLRYAGYVFNPISLYYCCDRDSRVRLVLADVSNTYGGGRRYWLRPADDSADRFRSVAAKSLFVSPFMPANVDYEFVLTPPGPTLVAHMNVTAAGSGGRRHGRIFDATLRLVGRPWTPRSIRGALVRWPWMTVKVIAAIHWEALRLRVKGVPTVPARSGYR